MSLRQFNLLLTSVAAAIAIFVFSKQLQRDNAARLVS